jgi:hypothetical protein
MAGCFACFTLLGKKPDDRKDREKVKALTPAIKSKSLKGRDIDSKHQDEDSEHSHSRLKVSFHEGSEGKLSRLPSTENARSRPVSIEKHVSFSNSPTTPTFQRPGRSTLRQDLELDIEELSRSRSSERKSSPDRRKSQERRGSPDRRSPERAMSGARSMPSALRHQSSTTDHTPETSQQRGAGAGALHRASSTESAQSSTASAAPPTPPRSSGGRLSPELIGDAVDSLAAAIRTTLSGLPGAAATGQPAGGDGRPRTPQYETRQGKAEGESLYLL